MLVSRRKTLFLGLLTTDAQNLRLPQLAIAAVASRIRSADTEDYVQHEDVGPN
jgi:hypothetical protein